MGCIPEAEPDPRGLQRNRRQVAGGHGKLAGLFRLLDEYGDEIEADLLSIYHLDLLDFYRGKLSARRIRVLLRQLPTDSALRRAQNDGKPVWSPTDHLLADLWMLILMVGTKGKSAGQDHPVRAAMEAAAKAAAFVQRLADLRADFNQRKRKYKKAFGR